MNALLVAIVALVCLLAGTLLGMALRARLPEHHLGQDATDVIKLAGGFMATLTALILGLLIFSANADRRAVESEFNETLASTALLDRYLVAYGQDTQEARELLRHFMVANGLAEARRLLTFQLAGIGPAIPTLIALIVWSTAIFTSFGLFVKMNPTVVVALFVSALSVSVAFYLDLNSPFTGLIHISSAAAHATLEVLGK